MTHITPPQATLVGLNKILLLLCITSQLNGCTIGGNSLTEVTTVDPPQGLLNPEDKLTVDCLLPGQLIRTGMYTEWMSPPRPALITAWQCAIQGGDYAVGTSSDARQTTINIWQQRANEGDKVAQNYLGEIYAKSWNTIKPDYALAAQWFRKAAEQGYSRAQNNLGTLYEQGLGVPKDRTEAYKLIRQAIGLIDHVNLDTSTTQQIQALDQKQEATAQELKKLQQQLSVTEQHLQQKQNELDELKKAKGSTKEQDIKQALKDAQVDKSKLQEQLTATNQALETVRKQSYTVKTQAALSDLPDLGQYHALIIGINNYQTPLHQLKTPVNDAKKVDEILRKKYGFKTLLITDDTPIKPTRSGIIDALTEFTKTLKPNDNLLIYYAGHGDISNGYSWLPQDAQSASPAYWISADDITKEISLPPMLAQHVLIVVDSCYPAGLINSSLHFNFITTAAIESALNTRATPGNLTVTTPLALSNIASISSVELVGSSPQAQVAWIKAKAKLPSRSTLTSGRLEKVLDEDSGNGLSIFANAFIDALKNNTGAISAEQISLDISPIVFANAQKMGGNQVPIYSPIEKTGDNHGEFFFIPRSR